eukprot:scaffold43615_cov31-Tisochrysis_lutea.AAC.1
MSADTRMDGRKTHQRCRTRKRCRTPRLKYSRTQGYNAQRGERGGYDWRALTAALRWQPSTHCRCRPCAFPCRPYDAPACSAHPQAQVEVSGRQPE